MSKNLGPIHYVMYNKIQMQNNLVNAIANIDESGAVSNALIEKYGETATGELEDVITVENIHGWLQGQVDIVEHKLAYVVSNMLNYCTIDDIIKVAYNRGVEASEEKILTVDEAYSIINHTLIDGMPCDKINQIIKQDDDEIIYVRRENIHEKYWEHGDIKNYDAVRNAFIEGMFADSSVVFGHKDNEYTLSLRK